MSTTTVGIGIAAMIVLLALYNVLFLFFHERILFQSETLEDDYVFQLEFPFEELTITPGPEVKLHGILLPTQTPKGLILYFHGNRGHLVRWSKIANQLRKYDYDVLVVDYRGYGKSRGLRSEELIYRDAQSVYDYAVQSLRYDNVVIYGRSLGTAVATHLASQRQVSQLILETPMTSIREVVPVLNFLLINKSWFPYEFNSLSRMKHITCPVAIFHGTDDAIVPYRMGVQLYDAIGHSSKKLITIRQGKHNNLDTFDTYQQAMERILR